MWGRLALGSGFLAGSLVAGKEFLHEKLGDNRLGERIDLIASRA
jgi:hypothetical protein